MSPWRAWPRASLAASALLIALVPAIGRAAEPTPAGQIAEHAPAPLAAARGTQTLLLATTRDDVALPDPLLARLEGGHIYVRAADARTLGVRGVRDGAEVDLAAVPYLEVEVDFGAQTLTVHDRRVRQRLGTAVQAAPAPTALTPSGWGAILNYDSTVLFAPGQNTAAATVEGIFYTPRGYAYAGGIAQTGIGGRRGKFTRLDSGYTFADPGTMQRLTLGDFINSNSSLSRPVRMAGVKFGTDFSIRPDVITFPVPTINGSAALPSAVDLVVNGNRRALGDVRAGQFSVADIPIQTGVNSVTVAVRDALGRQTLQTVTTYASRALLRPGLAAYSAEIGAIRTGYATDHDRYRELAGSGTFRIGITPSLTGEAHVEASSSVVSGSGGVSLALGPVGLIDLSAAASRSRRALGGSGTQFGIGFERVARPVSLSVRYTLASRGYADLATRYGELQRHSALVGSIGFDLAKFGTLSLSVLDLGRGRTLTDGDGGLLSLGDYGADRSRLVNASYSVHLVDRINLVANVGSDLRQRRSTFASIGALVVFGPRTTAYAGVNARQGSSVSGDAQIVRNAVEAGDWGYRASVSAGAIDRVAGGVEYLSQHGHVEAQVEETQGDIAARASARGSLVIAGGRLFTSDAVTGSFAVVDTQGQPGVTIYRDHRRIGVTDGSGHMLVPNLAGFQSTTFSIDPTEIPADLAIPVTEATVRPFERAGVKVLFDLRADQAATVTLVDRAGLPIAAGSRARGAAGDLPVGMGGEVYLDRLAPENALEVEMPNGRRCTAAFARPRQLGPASRIGPVVCLASGDQLSAR